MLCPFIYPTWGFELRVLKIPYTDTLGYHEATNIANYITCLTMSKDSYFASSKGWNFQTLGRLTFPHLQKPDLGALSDDYLAYEMSDLSPIT